MINGLRCKLYSGVLNLKTKDLIDLNQWLHWMTYGIVFALNVDISIVFN